LGADRIKLNILFDLYSQLHQFDHVFDIGLVVYHDTDATADFGFFDVPEEPAFAVVVESLYFVDIGVMLIKMIGEHYPKLLYFLRFSQTKMQWWG